ncbi:baculoviral IAP repeat-containing protein 7 [Pezoporus occidentalis]|uniref:baculoviral IAP repeat-containing protein 7 n=1 Tax=Pezoporus occidentalis TaxID=407982 RepID=UPI002F914F2B
MEDRRPAKETEPRAPSCHLFKRSMRNEARRLRTFRRWPATSPVSPRDLAKAGFFYLGPGDEVRCFCCSGILKDWAPGDCPAAEHRKFFPSCKFIRGEAVGNQEMLPVQEVVDTVDGQVVSLLQGMDSEEAAVPHEPEYPAMVTEEARLLTFQNCPRYAAMHYQALARAGFFYTGQGGIVRCFYCNGGVRNWQIESDPWWEHAKLFPGCEFLLQSRGRDFVSSVQESLSNTQVPRDSRGRTGQNPLASRETLRSLMNQALHCLDEFVIMYHVIEMGFDLISVCKAIQNKHVMTGASYISESELIADVLQAVRESSSAESRGAAQGEAAASSSREEMQSVQQRESDESRPSMEEQLQRLREERMCKVCLDKDVSVVFVPCGHLVACRECAFNLRLCPICRAVIQDRVRTFMS